MLPYTNKSMLTAIQKKRENMIDLVHKKGLANDDAIKCSQELDQLIYQYQLFFHKAPEKRSEGRRKIKQMVGLAKNRGYILTNHKKVENPVNGISIFL